MRCAMSSLVSTFHEAALSPEAWPRGLQALTDAAGVAGAALINFNKSTGNVDDACFSGLSAEFKPDYIRHYVALDPYSPLLDGRRMKLSECLPKTMLRKASCGVRAILGARLADTPRHFVIFGIHQQGRGFSEKLNSVVKLAGWSPRQKC